MPQTTLLFVHGGPSFADYLEKYIEPIESKFQRKYYSQINTDNLSLEVLLEQLHEKVQSIQNDVILIGHSWGPILCLEYLANFKNKVKGLVMLNTGLWHGHWHDIYQAKKQELSIDDEDIATIYLGGVDLKKGKAFLEECFETFNEEGFDHIEKNYIKNYDVRPLLQNLEIPILNVYGSADIRFPVEESRKIKELNPRVKDYELSGVGHTPFLCPKLTRKIFDFIESEFS